MKKIAIWIIGIGLLLLPPILYFVPEAKADEYDEEEETAVAVAYDVYDFSLLLRVPQVLNNTTSMGYRKFKAQRIKGKMYIVWREDGTYGIEFSDLVNKNFKVRGVNVTYEAIQDDSMPPRFNWIGDNAKDKFSTPCIVFSVWLEPSYALGGATEDNSFILALSAKGVGAYKRSLGCNVATRFSGYTAGRQGCSCGDYGHKSPTRTATMCGPGTRVDDVVASFGTWSAKWKSRCYCK